MSLEVFQPSITPENEPIGLPFIARELSIWAEAGAVVYSQMYYHVTRFSRDALTDLPFGETLTRHAGNMGPSSDMGIWPILLVGEGLKTYGERSDHQFSKLIYEIGDKLVPAITMAYIFHLNRLSELMHNPNPEGAIDAVAGIIIGGLAIHVVRNAAERIRRSPHEIPLRGVFLWMKSKINKNGD